MITLVRYEPAFLVSFIEWRVQASSVRHNPLKPMTKAEIGSMLASEGSDLSDLWRYKAYRWFVKLDDLVVGDVSLANISHMMKFAEIGYKVAESHQGRGLATAAVKLLVEMVFRETNLRKLMAYVHDRNVASCRVLEKVGFRQEGLLREHYIINGVPENELLFGLLKHEWRP